MKIKVSDISLKDFIVSVLFLAEEQANDINGDHWRDRVSVSWARMATHSEFGEFVDELKDLWCWWKPLPRVNGQKATEEFCDLLMFCSNIMCYNDPTITTKIKETSALALELHAKKSIDHCTNNEVDWLTIFDVSFATFMTTHEDEFMDRCGFLCAMIKTYCRMMVISYTELLEAFEGKIVDNQNRENWGKNR